MDEQTTCGTRPPPSAGRAPSPAAHAARAAITVPYILRQHTIHIGSMHFGMHSMVSDDWRIADRKLAVQYLQCVQAALSKLQAEK